jgi:hypothetical protein
VKNSRRHPVDLVSTLAASPCSKRQLVEGARRIGAAYRRHDRLPALLQVYRPARRHGSGNTIPEAGAIEVNRVDEQTLRARFRDLPGDYRLRDAVGSLVTQGTVQGAEGHRGANDGDNAFDETVLDIDWPGSR